MKTSVNYRINNDQFKELIKQGWSIIDVRSKMELKFLKVLKQSTNIPYPKVIDDMKTLFPDKTAKLIMVCNGGNRSGIAAKAYQDQGYKNVFVLDTGIEGLSNDETE